MDNMRARFRELPACRQLSPQVFNRVPGDAEIPFLRPHRPIVADQPLQPTAEDARQAFGKIRVEINDVLVGTDGDFPAVLRLPQLIPPPAFRLNQRILFLFYQNLRLPEILWIVGSSPTTS